MKLEADRRDFIKAESEIKIHIDAQQDHIQKLESQLRQTKQYETKVD